MDNKKSYYLFGSVLLIACALIVFFFIRSDSLIDSWKKRDQYNAFLRYDKLPDEALYRGFFLGKEWHQTVSQKYQQKGEEHLTPQRRFLYFYALLLILFGVISAYETKYFNRLVNTILSIAIGHSVIALAVGGLLWIVLSLFKFGGTVTAYWTLSAVAWLILFAGLFALLTHDIIAVAMQKRQQGKEREKEQDRKQRHKLKQRILYIHKRQKKLEKKAKLHKEESKEKQLLEKERKRLEKELREWNLRKTAKTLGKEKKSGGKPHFKWWAVALLFLDIVGLVQFLVEFFQSFSVK